MYSTNISLRGNQETANARKYKIANELRGSHSDFFRHNPRHADLFSACFLNIKSPANVANKASLKLRTPCILKPSKLSIYLNAFPVVV